MAKPNRNYNGQWEDYVVENGYPEWRQESQANYLQQKCLSPGHKAVSLRVLRKLRFHGKLPYLKKKNQWQSWSKMLLLLLPVLHIWTHGLPLQCTFIHIGCSTTWMTLPVLPSAEVTGPWRGRGRANGRLCVAGVFWVMVHNEQADHLNPQGNKVEKAKQNTNEPSTWV